MQIQGNRKKVSAQMEQQEYMLLERISEALRQLLMGDIPEEVDCSSCGDPAIIQLCETVNRVIRTFAEARNFLAAVSEGRLEVEPPPRNFLVSAFKQLHASLKHLTWQTSQITKGDLNQHVDFLGEFSLSFNAMIASLREKKAIEEALRESEKKLRELAATDVLTGIANRLKFNESLSVEISRAKRHNVPLSLIMFDIDHFKQINDVYGHHVGDVVLQEIVKLVSVTIRKEDIFARWGGEEFIILLPHIELVGGKSLAERLRLKIEQNTFSIINKATASFGVAWFENEDTAETFIERADRALYRAKELGRNRVE